jgi:hypothetical protein
VVQLVLRELFGLLAGRRQKLLGPLKHLPAAIVDDHVALHCCSSARGRGLRERLEVERLPGELIEVSLKAAAHCSSYSKYVLVVVAAACKKPLLPSS